MNPKAGSRARTTRSNRRTRRLERDRRIGARTKASQERSRPAPPRAVLDSSWRSGMAPRESLPVTAPLQAHDLSKAGRLEVSRRHDDLFALQPFHQGPSSLARQLRVHVGPRHPVRLVHLGRAVRGIAQDKCPFPLRGDQDAHVAGGVAGRWQRRQLPGDAVLAPHELHQPELGQRPDAGGGIGKALGLDPRLMADFPVLRAHPVASIRKGRHVLVSLDQEVPADMVAVQVSQHHHVHLFWPHSLGLKVTHELAPRDVRRGGGLGAETGVNEDRSPRRPYQVGAEVESHLVLLGEMGLVWAPVVGWDGREEVAQIELEHAVRQGHDFHIAHPDGIGGHHASSPFMARFARPRLAGSLPDAPRSEPSPPAPSPARLLSCVTGAGGSPGSAAPAFNEALRPGRQAH